MAKATLSVPMERLLEVRAKLQKSLEEDGELIIETKRKNYYFDHRTLEKEILKIDLELEQRKRLQEQEDRDVVEGNVIRANGQAALNLLGKIAAEQLLEINAPLIKAGRRQVNSNEKRSKAMKGKKFKDCPLDFFNVKELINNISRVKVTSDVGLLLVHGNIDFNLTLYTAESLQKAFFNSFGFSIAIRTWQKWKNKEYSKSTRARRFAYAKKFSQK